MVLAQKKDWASIEQELAAKEAELLQKEGSVLKEEHLNGYRYVPTVKVVDKASWDTFAVPHVKPSCTSENWHHKDLLFEIGEGIAYLTLNRPDVNNVLSESMAQALQDATCELHVRRDIRIVVLRAEGSMFCAGGDPKHFFDALAMSEREDRKAAIGFMKFLFWFQSLPQFTVGLAQGSAMGTGIALLCVCDMVLAASNARFTCSEVKLGFCPAAIAPSLTRKVGPAFAKRLLCMAENISAEQAKRMGLVSDVVEEESEFSDYMKEICEKVTPGSGSLSDWMGSLTPADAVELARAATKEAQRAVQHHATQLFGSEIELLQQLDYGPDAVQQLQLSDESRRRLSLEAAAFGAALFDAESSAGRRYRLEYTATGSRADGPLG